MSPMQAAQVIPSIAASKRNEPSLPRVTSASKSRAGALMAGSIDLQAVAGAENLAPALRSRQHEIARAGRHDDAGLEAPRRDLCSFAGTSCFLSAGEARLATSSTPEISAPPASRADN